MGYDDRQTKSNIKDSKVLYEYFIAWFLKHSIYLVVNELEVKS